MAARPPRSVRRAVVREAPRRDQSAAGVPLSGGARGRCVGRVGDVECPAASAERITVVAYYRTRLETCGTAEAERLRAETYAARANAKTEAAADAAALAALTTTETT